MNWDCSQDLPRAALKFHLDLAMKPKLILAKITLQLVWKAKIDLKLKLKMKCKLHPH